MGKHGLRIKNIEASTLYEANLGIRFNYEYKNSMFTNSLFYDFLIENGIEILHEKSTRDIIGIDFGWGTRSYDEDIKRLKESREKYLNANIEQSVNNIDNIIEKAHKNKDKYNKMSKDELRDCYYKNGCDVTYTTRNKKNEIVKSETLHYKFLYRSTGKAKKGSCIFIRDNLYDKAKNFLQMGIEMPDENAPIVEMLAYSPLVSSTIVDKIKIHPDNILILKDVDSFFETNVVSVETDKFKQCVAKKIDKYKLKNTMFDGQALIDSSIFPKWGNGYLLLRHHMCKMASFNTNIQLFMKDYFGDQYETAKIKDMWGNEYFAKDVLLITTENAVKWTKFDVSYEYWCEKVKENGCNFGIVKTAHESKLGDVQRMSYQMVNSLDTSIMESASAKTVEYINKLKSDDDEFLKYLEKNSNFSNDYKVLVALVSHNKDFLYSEYFRERKKAIIKGYVLNFKSGKVIQNGDNLVLVGSPYAMLLHSVGDDVGKDPCFKPEDDCIQCYTGRFEDDEYIAGFRSPHNAKNNIVHLHNVHSDEILKYFNLGKLVIAVNCNETDIQDRLNG